MQRIRKLILCPAVGGCRFADPYKLMTENMDPTDKIGVDLLYRKYMMAPYQDVMRKGKAFIKDKSEMLEIIEEMEWEKLEIFSPEDGQVVIIGQLLYISVMFFLGFRS